jgi:hypothetical protein
MTEIDALHRLRLSEQPWPAVCRSWLTAPSSRRSFGERKEGNALLVDLYVQDFAVK